MDKNTQYPVLRIKRISNITMPAKVDFIIAQILSLHFLLKILLILIKQPYHFMLYNNNNYLPNRVLYYHHQYKCYKIQQFQIFLHNLKLQN